MISGAMFSAWDITGVICMVAAMDSVARGYSPRIKTGLEIIAINFAY
jgi:hypothetical protein